MKSLIAITRSHNHTDTTAFEVPDEFADAASNAVKAIASDPAIIQELAKGAAAVMQASSAALEAMRDGSLFRGLAGEAREVDIDAEFADGYERFAEAVKNQAQAAPASPSAPDIQQPAQPAAQAQPAAPSASQAPQSAQPAAQAPQSAQPAPQAPQAAHEPVVAAQEPDVHPSLQWSQPAAK